jgi:release factor glutamine methyltransferase
MKLKTILEHGRQLLGDASIEESRLESELLMRETLKLNRVGFYLEMENTITPQQETSYLELIKRRLTGEPSAYILKRREFYGLELFIDNRVLIPRPETELLVETTLEAAKSCNNPIIADIGCGSGAITLALALKLPEASIYAIDVSKEALGVARLNLAKYGATDRVTFLEGDLVIPLPKKVDIIVANLPYVNKDEAVQNTFEPAAALDGGADGTDVIKRLCAMSKDKLNKGGVILLEIGYGQSKALTTYIKQVLPEAQVEISLDLAGIERVLTVSLP